VLYASKEKRVAWIYGIISSLLAMYLFVEAKLYSETLLYSYYLLAGVYGFLLWKKDKGGLAISKASNQNNILFIVLGIAGAFVLGWFFSSKSDAELPYFDAFTTSFSFIATWMTARKILQNWIFWIVIDLAGAILYSIKELYVLAGLMFVYSLIAIYGYYQWKKTYTKAGRDLRA
jgi:nicotinamide mononucleotide transporter